MAVFTENDTGVERLYIGGISASSLYDTLPGYQDPAVRRFPAPRMLWTEDGTTWNAVPQTPGTFFGDLNVQTEKVNKRGFRSFLTLPDANGVNRLFATVSDLRGVGRVIESSNPSAGDNAWRQVSPSADDLPIFTIATYRDQIYATVGDDGFPNGYAIYKTDAATPDAADPSRYQFMPVVVGDGSQLMRARTAISMQEFHGDLYVGSDRPTELIRIHPDDTWDLIVGAARMTTSGFKVPLSGLNKGFNSMFNGHFYSMAAYNGDLYLGTWDWSQDLIGTPLDGIFNYQYGFDLFKTDDGVHWSVIDRRGLGDRLNSSVRNLEVTPFGLFVGATNPYFGLQIFLNSTVLDLNRDGVIDNDDIYIVVSSQNQPAESPSDPRDLDRDGVITLHDAELFATQCTHPDCSHGAPSNVDPPTGLEAVFQNGTPPLVGVTWNGPSTASRYHVFRSDPTSLVDLLPPTMTIPLPNGSTITVQDIRNGALDIPCQAGIIPADFCALVQAVRENTTSTRGFHWIGSTSNLYFLDTSPPASGDSLYYVVAEDASGRISEPTPAVSTVGR
ncbi:MAG: hypothetical protein DMF88_14095 [Acidobacteria bacterium]|nr:MAG: hypothetical protein DMF88_14095 [Acidobacteriota bacterium]